MKTAMQEALDNIDYIVNECKKGGQLNDFTEELLNDVIKSMLQSQLETEKEQIKTSYHGGKWDNISGRSLGGGEDYYEKTYNNQNNIQ